MTEKLRWILAGLFLGYGIITIDLAAWKWSALGIILYSLPLLMQSFRSTLVKVWSLWIGVFLVVQSLISPLFGTSDFVTLQPNYLEIIDVKGGIPGISGKQRITTDSKGFRTTKPIDYSHKQGYRIFAIGGSTTEEIQSDDRSTWTYVLQEELTRRTRHNVEVINTGVSGTRAKNHLATLRKIIPMKPDLVIFYMGFNDWNHFVVNTFSRNSHPYWLLLGESRDGISLRKTLLGNALHGLYYSIEEKVKKPKPLLREDYGECYSRERNSLGRAIKYSFHPRDVYPEYKRQLSRISSLCQENNIKCIFITQATGYRQGASEEFKKGFWMTPPVQSFTLDFESLVDISSLYNSFLIKFAKENGHGVCDAAAKLEPSYDIFFDDCHFNTEGARKFGHIVSDCVEHYVK